MILNENETILTNIVILDMEKQTKMTRTEIDLLGSVEVPEEVLYGVQTMRGLEPFSIRKFRLCD